MVVSGGYGQALLLRLSLLLLLLLLFLMQVTRESSQRVGVGSA